MDKNHDWLPFCELMNASAEVTASQPRSRNALVMMFDCLAQYSFKQVSQAVGQHFKTKDGKFFPTISHLVLLIEGDPDEKAEVAWRYFIESFKKWSAYDSVRYPNPVYHFVIQGLGGWKKVNEDFSNMGERDINFYGKDFRKLYTIGMRSATWDNVPPYFQGSFETQNKLNGYLDAVPPVYEVASGKERDRETLMLANKEDKLLLQLTQKVGTRE